MKTQNNNFFTTLNNNQMTDLVQEVKETIATQAPTINPNAAFTAADLWNLERNRRNRVIRRHLV
jgi:protein-arginine kinase